MTVSCQVQRKSDYPISEAEFSEREALRGNAATSKGPMTLRPRPAICIIVENQSVPFDRRVWQEALALSEAGYHVSVICPKAPACQSSRETLEGIDIYRHWCFNARGRGRLAYFCEYGFAFVAELFLAWKIYAKTRFRALQACNPPDTLFLIALSFKMLGVRFVFDHHDLSPELYDLKFTQRGLAHKLVRLAERLTFRVADLAISTNESYQEVAVTRGKMNSDRTVVVQTCADLCEVNGTQPVPALKRGKRFMVAYVGVMESQDGVCSLMESIAYLVKERHREDTLFVLIGSGTELPRLKVMAAQLGVEKYVEFTGLIPHDRVGPYLSTADVCVAPDPLNPLNDKCTMIKILEYMAYSRPIVLYDLQEGRHTAGDGALYARSGDPVDFANQIERLLESELRRKELGDSNRRRTVQTLNWTVQSAKLIDAFQSLLASDVALQPLSEVSRYKP